MTAQPRLVLDRASAVPLHLQVARQVEHAITSGELRPGDRLPTEIDIAADLGLSRPTVRQAMQALVDQGLVVRRRGVGTQVLPGRVRRPVALTSLHDDLLAAGRRPATRVLGLDRRRADADLAVDLGLDPGSPVWSLRRLRLSDDEPLAVMTNHLAADLLDLAAEDLEHDGLYAALRRAGVVLAVARQQIGARRAGEEEAALLGEEVGAPLLTVERTTFDHGGRVVEVGTHSYRPDLHTFESTLLSR